MVFLNYKKPNLNDARIYNLPDDQQQEQTIDDRNNNNNNNNNNNKQHKKTINNTNRFNEKINLQLKRPDMIGNWYVRWENHRRKIPIFINGQYKFTCYNINYQLLDTNPISFKWKNDDENAVVQTMVSFNGHQIVWTTTDERYQTIYWHWNGPGLHPCLTNFKQEYAMANILLKDNLKLLEFKKQPTVPRYLNINKSLKEYNVPPSNGIHQLLHRHHGSDRNNNNMMKKTSVHDLDSSPPSIIPDIGFEYPEENSKNILLNKRLEIPKLSNYFHVKLLNSYDHGDNVDIRYIGIRGIELPKLDELLSISGDNDSEEDDNDDEDDDKLYTMIHTNVRRYYFQRRAFVDRHDPRLSIHPGSNRRRPSWGDENGDM